MQIGIDVGATKIESVVLEDNGKEQHRSRTDCPKDYNLILSTIVMNCVKAASRKGGDPSATDAAKEVLQCKMYYLITLSQIVSLTSQ